MSPFLKWVQAALSAAFTILLQHVYSLRGKRRMANHSKKHQGIGDHLHAYPLLDKTFSIIAMYDDSAFRLCSPKSGLTSPPVFSNHNLALQICTHSNISLLQRTKDRRLDRLLKWSLFIFLCSLFIQLFIIPPTFL